MPLSDSELKALKADAKRKVVSAGDSLFVGIESVGKGGGKSFLGTQGFPNSEKGYKVHPITPSFHLATGHQKAQEPLAVSEVP